MKQPRLWSALSVLACTCHGYVRAQQLPYNPTYLVQTSSNVYQFSSDQLSVYNTAKLTSSTEPESLGTLPFSAAYVPVLSQNGLTVFSGDCTSQEVDLWSYGFGAHNQSWSQMHTTVEGQLAANYLSAAFTFPNGNTDDVYIFGGMCPNGSNATWTQDATYSNTLLQISPDGSGYDVALTGARSPPIAEAGLSITPLEPTSFSSGDVQQNFVLLGGHTSNAFINMSQVAMFSMPEQSWAFVGIQQAQTIVEPRSGHTAVLSGDGSRIYLYGGWVGNVSNPASPQLAILNIGSGYGGNGSWSWSVPDQSSGAMFGHGATMLPGDVMMITGGWSIGSMTKRAPNMMFYDTKSELWLDSYSNPNLPLTPKAKTGLGVGLGVGISAAVLLSLGILIYLRRKVKKRQERERYLRGLALGTHDDFSVAEVSRQPSGVFGQRSASWGARQEEAIQHNDRAATPATLDVPGPRADAQMRMKARGMPGFGYAAPGPVFTIEEVEERSERGSLRPDTANSRPLSDPFKDPQETADASRRRKEVETWVDDWQQAAENMNLSRSTSKANIRTYSSLSAYHSTSAPSSSESSHDRTNSDLSESSNWSTMSFTKSGTGVMRTPSQTTRASHALFSGAAAAMSRIAGREPERKESKRVVSQGDLTQMAARKQATLAEQTRHVPPLDMSRINDHPNFYTPPESPLKVPKGHARKRSNSACGSNSLTNSSKRALDAFSHGARRILTGTGQVNVGERVTAIEEPQMAEISPRRVSSSGAAFLQHRQGARDWDEPESSGTVRRRRVNEDEAEDWDVEQAVQQRVVQVMFTVPKEKLRVVNADNLSLISRTDTNRSKSSVRSDEEGVVATAQVATMLHPDSAGRMIRTSSGGSGVSIGKAI